VAAHLLLQQGYAVEGLFMKNWEEDDDPATVPPPRTWPMPGGRRAARHPLHTVNFATEYWDRVFEHFLAEYRALRTPNPDVLCNREIKFRAFLDHALDLGADWIAPATMPGWCATPAAAGSAPGADADKDQTYFLHLLDQAQLWPHAVSAGRPDQGRGARIARRLGLANAEKKDSTGICFIGERRFADFLARWLPSEPGPIETPEGRVVWASTAGSPGTPSASARGSASAACAMPARRPGSSPAKDADRNALIVVQGKRSPAALQPTGCAASSCTGSRPAAQTGTCRSTACAGCAIASRCKPAPWSSTIAELPGALRRAPAGGHAGPVRSSSTAATSAWAGCITRASTRAAAAPRAWRRRTRLALQSPNYSTHSKLAAFQ
jgi:tRNA-specific 2-thiouridylase